MIYINAYLLIALNHKFSLHHYNNMLTLDRLNSFIYINFVFMYTIATPKFCSIFNITI